MTNILIGIGGTGAKVVEAALTLFTAGLGPEKVHIGLIDQDRSNGNINRTQTRISNLRRFQTIWGQGKGGSRIDWTGGSQNQDRLEFGGVEIAELLGDRSLWCPEKDDLTLGNIIGQDLSPQRRDLFNLLFMQGEHEQDLVLGEGYRGRAHVGAAALVAAMLDRDNKLVREIGNLMKANDGPVRIFLIGSAFGGTGAAGFPTLARELHRIRSDPDFKGKDLISIGGALMLPYFGFDQPDDDGDPVVTPDELLPKARLALEYYGRLFENENTFDRFYVMGWNPRFSLGYHEPGNYEQRNPPLVPELFAATAAVEFFTRTYVEAERVTVPVMLSARAEQGVRWSDFPLDGIEEKLGQLVRFCAYWLYVAEDLLKKTSFFGTGNWTQELRGRMKPVDHELDLVALRTVARDVLLWAATLERTARDNWVPGPWRSGGFYSRHHDPSPTEPIALADTVPHAEPSFDELIRADTGEPLDRDSAAVYADLVGQAPQLARGAHEGYGKVVAAAYRAVSLR